MARLRNRKQQAIHFFLNGKRANYAYGLSKYVGRYVGRVDVAKKRATASLVRRAGPVVSREIRSVYNVSARQLSGKIRAKDTGDSLRVYAFQRATPLMAFGGKWAGRKSPGAMASVLRGQPEIYEQSFIRTVNGLRSIRVRQRPYGRLSGPRFPRGPLQMLYGPSPHNMIHGVVVNAETRSTGSARYPTRVRENATWQLTRFYVRELKRLMDLGVGRGR